MHRARARPSPLSALGAEPPITRHAPRRIAPALPSRGRRGADSCAADRAEPTSSPASQVVDVSPRGRLNWPATCLAFVVWRLPGIRLAARNGKHDLQDTTTFQDEPQYNARWAASDLLPAHVVLQTSLLPGACSDTHSGAPSLNIHSNSRPSGCGRAGVGGGSGGGSGGGIGGIDPLLVLMRLCALLWRTAPGRVFPIHVLERHPFEALEHGTRGDAQRPRLSRRRRQQRRRRRLGGAWCSFLDASTFLPLWNLPL